MNEKKSQESNPVIQEIIRDEKGKFVPGVSGNPNGRPKGKTLKEYQAEKFRMMTDEEKEAFLSDVAKEIRWKMSEGNPKQDTEVKGNLTISQVLDQLDGSKIEGQTVEVESPVQDPQQSGETGTVQTQPSADTLSGEQVVSESNTQS